MSSVTDAASTETPSTQLAATPETLPPKAQRRLTRAAQVEFLEELARWGNVRAAAARTGLNRASLHRMRRACPRFRSLWDAALVLARPQVEEVLADRALNGVTETVFCAFDVSGWLRQPVGRGSRHPHPL